METAKLVLEDGTEYPGRLFGFPKPVAGEVVFNTGMVGYTESLSDPSYSGQILCLTYPLVGNYGVPPAFESGKIQVIALVVCELADEYSHAMAQKSLPQWLREQEIPCLAGVDTEKLRMSIAQQTRTYLTDFIPAEYFGQNNQFIVVGLRELIAKARSDSSYKIDRTLIDDLLETMEQTSLCALGGGVPLPIKNALQYFGEEMAAYFKPRSKA